MTKEKILHVVCREFNLTPDDIFQPDRTEGARNGNKVFARKLCMTFSRLYNLNNESEIGDYFHRDRCTVYAAVKTVANDIKTNRNRKLIYDNILIELEKEEPLVTLTFFLINLRIL